MKPLSDAEIDAMERYRLRDRYEVSHPSDFLRLRDQAKAANRYREALEKLRDEPNLQAETVDGMMLEYFIQAILTPTPPKD